MASQWCIYNFHIFLRKQALKLLLCSPIPLLGPVSCRSEAKLSSFSLTCLETSPHAR